MSKKEYYILHKDEFSKRSKKYYEENKEKIKEYTKKWTEINAEKLKEQRKARNIKNKEENSQYQKEYRKNNKDKVNKRIEEWRLNNLDRVKNNYKKRLETQPEKEKLSARKSYLKAKYGITLEDYNSMCALQNNSCAICGVVFDGKEKLHVDHDHNSGKVRGLLCGNCNRAIGIMKDDESLLQKAIKYLKRSKQ